MLLSAACAVHCALAPLVLAVAAVTALPGAVLGVFGSPVVEWALVGSAVVIGGWSVVRARRERRLGLRAPLLLGAGFTALVGGRLLEGLLPTMLTLPPIVLGGVAVAAAHVELRRARAGGCAT